MNGFEPGPSAFGSSSLWKMRCAKGYSCQFNVSDIVHTVFNQHFNYRLIPNIQKLRSGSKKLDRDFPALAPRGIWHKD